MDQWGLYARTNIIVLETCGLATVFLGFPFAVEPRVPWEINQVMMRVINDYQIGGDYCIDNSIIVLMSHV